MATHSSVLALRIPGTGSLVGCRLWRCTESDTTKATQQQQQQQQLTLEAEQLTPLLGTSAHCWLLFTIELICIMISYTDTCTHAQMGTKISQNSITLALCSGIFYHICSILDHIKDKMMVTRHKIYFLIHWLHLQFDIHCPSPPLFWVGLLVHVNITQGASLLF